MKEEYAEALDGDTSALVERWDGNPRQFAEDVFRVRDPEDGALHDLELIEPYQPKLLDSYFYGDEEIINVYKGRRIGVSFIFCVAILIEALSIPESNYAIVSRTKSQSEERIGDIKDLLKHSRLGFNDLDADLPKNNKGYIILPNGAEIRAFSGDPDAARGFDSAKTVMVDEQAFIDDQEAVLQAFMSFINLVPGARMLQISTPRVSNDKFMETHGRGTEYGNEGVISVKQPSFANNEEIDPTVSLYEQEIQPVRDFQIGAVEAERAQDPKGFAQEYLCQPISDEYSFFTSEGIQRAQRRGAAIPERYDPESGKGGGKATESNGAYWHPATHARCGGMMVMGVDIATGVEGGDDTTVAVFEHAGEHRYLRFHTAVGREDLRAVDVLGDPKNPEDLAKYLYRLAENMGVEKLFVDKTGPGTGFRNSINKLFGRRAQGFNFTDQEELDRMMGDFNYGLHNDHITLVPDESIYDQLNAMVKTKSYKTSKPKYSGKEYSKDGKDDMAMALVLGAYPPNFEADRSHSAHQREGAYGEEDSRDQREEVGEGEPLRQPRQVGSDEKIVETEEGTEIVPKIGSARPSSSRSGSRKNRHPRRNRSRY
jgi:phage FluMu gp28-like protein